MNIYDKDYLSQEEIAQLTTQNAIDLAISNTRRYPLETIIPDTIYRYELDMDTSSISAMRLEYAAQKREKDTQRDIMWDDFINHEPIKDSDWFEDRQYVAVAYRTEKGFFVAMPKELNLRYHVPIACIHNKNLKYKKARVRNNVLYTMDLIDDNEIRRRIEYQNKEEVCK